MADRAGHQTRIACVRGDTSGRGASVADLTGAERYGFAKTGFGAACMLFIQVLLPQSTTRSPRIQYCKTLLLYGDGRSEVVSLLCMLCFCNVARCTCIQQSLCVALCKLGLHNSAAAAAAVWPEMYFTLSDAPTNTVHVVEAGRVSSGPAMGSGSVGKTACNFCREGTRYILILYSVERTLSD